MRPKLTGASGTLVAAAVVLCLAGVTVAAGASLAVDAANPGGTAAATTPDAGFETDRIYEQEGDVAAITVTLTDTDTATVNVGSRENGYLVQAAVTDGDGDGQVTLLMNTYEAGGWRGTPPSGVFSTADPDDSVTPNRRTGDLSAPLEPFSYSMNVTVDGLVYGAATLFVEDRSTDAVRTLGAPADAGDVTDSVAVADTVAVGDYAVVQVEASGVFGYVGSAADLEDGTQGVSLSVVQTDAGPNREPKELPPSAATFVPAPDRDSFFLVYDTGGLDVEPGERYRATFTVDESNPLTDATETATATFEVAAVNATVDETQGLAPESGQTITGTTTLAAGTDLTVRVESLNPSEPYLDRLSVTADASGSWGTTLDLSSFSAGTTLRVSVSHDDQRLGGPRDVTIGGGSPAAEIRAVDVPDRIVAGETVTASATVANVGDAGGTITVELQVRGRVVDAEDVSIPPGESRDLSFTISTEGVPPGTYDYTLVAGSASEPGTVDVVAETATPTATRRPTTTAAPTTTTVPETTTPAPTTTLPDTTTPAPRTPRPTTTTVPETTTPAPPTTTTVPDTTTPAPRTPRPTTTTAATSVPAGTTPGEAGTTPGGTATSTNATTTTAADDGDGTAVSFDAEGSPGFAVTGAILALLVLAGLRRR